MGVGVGVGVGVLGHELGVLRRGKETGERCGGGGGAVGGLGRGEGRGERRGSEQMALRPAAALDDVREEWGEGSLMRQWCGGR